jgi:hypothetical protein
MRRPPGARAAFLLRAKDNRRLAQRKAQRDLWTARQEAPPLGHRTFAFARPPPAVTASAHGPRDGHTGHVATGTTAGGTAPIGLGAAGRGHACSGCSRQAVRSSRDGCRRSRGGCMPSRALMLAWRIPLLTLAGRAYPEVSCAVGFAPRAWQTSDTMPHRCHPPQAPPAWRASVRSLAPRGGVCARQGDGAPGMQAIWQGDQRLHEGIYAVDSHRTLPAL